MIHNKAGVEGCIEKIFACKEIRNFSSMYFPCANNVNTPTTQYHVVKDVPLSELAELHKKHQQAFLAPLSGMKPVSFIRL
jgi:hypothetical protein